MTRLGAEATVELGTVAAALVVVLLLCCGGGGGAVASATGVALALAADSATAGFGSPAS